jgi:hypothetical protein
LLTKETGLLFILLGAVLVLVGVLAYFGGLSWFGKLPGDVRIETERSRFFLPITSMLLLSAALSLASYLWQRWLK